MIYGNQARSVELCGLTNVTIQRKPGALEQHAEACCTRGPEGPGSYGSRPPLLNGNSRIRTRVWLCRFEAECQAHNGTR